MKLASCTVKIFQESLYLAFVGDFCSHKCDPSPYSQFRSDTSIGRIRHSSYRGHDAQNLGIGGVGCQVQRMAGRIDGERPLERLIRRAGSCSQTAWKLEGVHEAIT